MIQVTPQMRVLVAVEPVDFRKGIDGLARVARDELSRDPFSGWVFIFRNRRPWRSCISSTHSGPDDSAFGLTSTNSIASDRRASLASSRLFSE
ncbi:MAG: IS66 family insertion sequence element accessory protein TnpB [Planctomycetes bacterium]|nr:IS66 family insertion sequence element accessory protein TnpB [Planctomycetota bacterium]